MIVNYPYMHAGIDSDDPERISLPSKEIRFIVMFVVVVLADNGRLTLTLTSRFSMLLSGESSFQRHSCLFSLFLKFLIG